MKTPLHKEKKIAIIGHRGIPNSYGGFETLAEKLAECLVGCNLPVIVYCRSHYFSTRPATYKGADLVYLPTIAHKAWETFVHTLLSTLHIIFRRTADTIIVVNVGNAPFAALAKLFGKKVIFCVDGLDWERKKWGRIARLYLKACSYLAPLAAHEIVTDAGSVREFYRTRRGAESSLIPYGTDIEPIKGNPAVLAELGLTPKNYFIYVARFEPENNPILVIESYLASGSTLPLVMIGDNRYNPEFVNRIKAKANGRVIFLGYVFGERYKTLLKDALAYIRAAEVGGASPAVIEAMGQGVCVIANDKPENREMLHDTGMFYALNKTALSRVIQSVTDNPDQALRLGERTGQRAMLLYSWDTIVHEFVKIIKKVSREETLSLAPALPTTQGAAPRILMTGAGGMLGEALYEHFSKKYTVHATDIDLTEPWLTYLDVRDVAAYEKTISDFRPDYIFHLAAQTSLEDCEKNPANAYATNALATKYAAQLANRYGAKLVYVSSAGVFNGQEAYYIDTDEPQPINVYGLTKQIGALMTEYYAPNHLIIRPGWMMGGGPAKDKKFINAIVKQILAGKQEIYAVTDKLGTPSYTRDIAVTLERVLDAGGLGTYNMVSPGFASRYDVAKEILRQLGRDKDISLIPVDSGHFASTFFANRPASENLVNARLTAEGLSLMRPWQAGLEDYLKQDFAHAFAEPKTAMSVAQPLMEATA